MEQSRPRSDDGLDTCHRKVEAGRDLPLPFCNNYYKNYLPRNTYIFHGILKKIVLNLIESKPDALFIALRQKSNLKAK